MGGRLLCSVLSKSHRTLSRASFRMSTTVRTLRPIHTLPHTKISPKSPIFSPRISLMVVRGVRTTFPNYGLDYKHWFIEVKEPDPDMTRDEIIDMYIKMLASVVGSEQEARMKLYSVSTKYYYAFGALISEELASKFKDMSNVVNVFPDCYKVAEDKDYGGEPFIDGKPVPYDPKYHASNILFEKQKQGIPYLDDSDDDLDERTGLMGEIEGTMVEEIEDADIEPGTGADAEIPDADADYKWYSPSAWLSKARDWWKR